MNDDISLLLRIADIAVSLAILVAVVTGFVRGDILSRRSIEEIVSLTVKEVLHRIERP